MADIHKMAGILVFTYLVCKVRSHNEASSSAESESTDSRNDLDSKEGTYENYRRNQFKRPPVKPGQEWQYEGLPIDVPRGKSLTKITSTTPSTTTTPKPIYPPMHPRYRRIYNPDESTSVEEFPFMAALLVNKELWCGAVVIDTDRILTAAHCLQLQYNNRFFREYVKMLTVRVGSTNATAGGEVLRVVEISFHPNYKPETLEFNAALIRLHKNITFGKKDTLVDSIEYTKEKELPMDHNVTFLGWGSVLGSGGLGGQVLLQRLDLPVYDLTDCQEVYGKDLVTRSNFCAGFITLSKNVCNHDAGGPAIMDGKLVGILSFSSKRCDISDQPAVFTSVGAISAWVDGLEEKKLRVA